MKLYITLALLLIASFAFASPVLVDPTPANNSYTGKGIVAFFVNSTSPAVTMFVISDDAYINQEPWDNYTMSCSDGRCSRAVSFSIVGSDTLEYLYFEASDENGTTQLATPAAPLRFRIDRTFPQIIFNSPANNSYVSGTQNISVSVSDTISGVNVSSLAYSIGAGWIPFNGVASFDTTQFSNGQTVIVSVNATDNARNSGTVSVSVVADNAAPSISAVYPDGIVVKGVVSFNMTATDVVSGINRSFVTINGTDFQMSCSSVCNATISTLAYTDGALSAVFRAYDNAGNSASSTVNFSVLNTPPPIVLAPKGYSNTYPLITANLSNPDSIVTGVVLNITKTNLTSVAMSCNPGFTLCSYQLPSWGEGVYELAAVAQNIVGHAINDSGTLTIDATMPGLTTSIPDVIKSAYSIGVQVADDNNDRNGVTLTILGNTQSFTCVPQGLTLYCSMYYNFGSINDGRYNATINATDLAGNSATYTKDVLVDRNPPLLLDTLVEPLNPEVGKGVLITAVLFDEGSDVASANAIVTSSMLGAQPYPLIREGPYNWSVSFFTSVAGSYNVALNATDENGNSVTFSNAGYFFMGDLNNCGNDVCDAEENYCLCPSDCAAQQCSYGQLSCVSGIPTCGTKSPPGCGDNVCSVGENCNTCSKDCGTCLGSAPNKVTKSNSTKPPKVSAPGNEVSQTAGDVFQFAASSTPIFVTAVAIIILAGIVVFVVVKKRRRYY